MKRIKQKIAENPQIFIQYGTVIFTLGILIAIVAAFFPQISKDISKTITISLIIFGIVIGILNITNKESTSFMVAVLIFIMLIPMLIGTLNNMYKFNISYWQLLISHLMSLLIPAAIVVALKTIFLDAKNEN